MPKQIPPDVSAESTGVLDDLRRIVRALRESSREAEQQLGVSGAQLFVLRSLAEVGPLSLGQLAERTRTHQSTVSVVAKRLVEAELVQRSVPELDARSIQLSLTRRGRALLARAPLAAQHKLIDGIERLTEKQRQLLASSLRGLVAAMQLDDVSTPAMFFEEDEPGGAQKPASREKGARRVRA